MVTGSRGKSGSGGESPSDWLENELRETKGRLHKVEAELAQALKQTYGLEGEMRKLLETMSSAGSIEAGVVGVREEVRQMRELVSRLQDRQAVMNSRLDQVLTQRTTEAGRDRNEIAAAVKQIEVIERVVEQSDARGKAIEEALRRLDEEVAGMRLANAAIDRSLEDMTARAGRTHETTMRIDQEQARAAGALARVEKFDEGMSERVNAYVDQLRRAFERLDKLETLATFADETRESLQRVAVEREQLAAKIAGVDHIASQLVEDTSDFTQLLAKIDQRVQNQTAEIMAQAGLLADLTERTNAATKKMYKMLLGQRKRRSEALNQEIKELTAGEIHASD
ncbi:MAG: hypothetical protein ABI559_02285 [Chloroflexota bacterium]